MLQHHYADVNGVRLHYVSAGEGTLLMFLHGFPEFWYEWKNQLREFGRDHFAVAPDMRGYNLSAKPAGVENYGVKHLVEDVRALAESLGHEKFTLVGHDWGGAVAWAFAIRHPEYLEKLIIINAPHPAIFQRELRTNPDQQKASRYMLFLRSPEAEEKLARNNYARLAAAVLEDGLAQGYFNEEDRDAYIEAWSRPGALTGSVNYYRAARIGPPSADGENPEVRPAITPPAMAVTTPTLVIWGERDTALLDGNLNGLEEFVPDLTVRRIPDGTHWVIHEKPALVNGLIREFMMQSLHWT